MKFGQVDLIGENKNNIHEKYEVLKQLGSGAYSVVYEAVHRITKDHRCIKKIQKQNFTKEEEESIMNEIQILREIDHPNILNIVEFFQNEKNIFLVMEQLDGGELFDRIIEQKKMTEKQAQDIIKQILSAVAYLHSRKIIHRDLKPENLMFESKKPDCPIKIIDFGTSRKFKPAQKLKAKMGTAYYIAPEVLNKNYDEKCDVWSCGVILYVLLCGYPPFNGKNDEIIFRKIKEGKFVFQKEDWQGVSPEAQDLITKMLTVDPSQRLSAEQALSHPWLKLEESKLSLESNKTVLSNLLSFKSENQLQKAIMLYFVTFYDIREEKRRLAEIFRKLDKDGDGQLSQEELIKGLQIDDPVIKKDGVEKFLKEVDFNGTEGVDFTEFIVANYNYRVKLNKTKLKELFMLIDSDKSGTISVSEMMDFFNYSSPENEKQIKDLIKEVDTDQDGSISFAEFEKAMEGIAERGEII